MTVHVLKGEDFFYWRKKP